MKRETFQKWYETYQKGTYVVVIKDHTLGDFSKVTKMVTRFVNYYNIESVKAKGTSESKPREYEIQIIPHILKENTNTKNTLLMCYKTNHHKAYSTYYYKGMEISEEEYYSKSGDKKKTYGDTPLFAMKLNEIVSVGGIQ